MATQKPKTQEQRRARRKVLETKPAKPWEPPFCANEVPEVTCPACGDGPVCVREHDEYYDGSDYQAFCSECHVELTVYAALTVSFGDVEVTEYDFDPRTSTAQPEGSD